MTPWFQALGGLGLFLLSLRLLTGALDRTLSDRFKSLFRHRLQAPWAMGAMGLGATVVLQASAVTIVATMGLLQTGWLGLEQAFFAMLGATVGTTLKAWVAASAHSAVGLALVGLTSLGLVAARSQHLRDLLEAVLAIGLFLAALEMLAGGSAALLVEADLLSAIGRLDGTGLGPQLLAVLLGFGLTVAMQSSSSVVFLAMDLAARGIVDLPAGAALLLGANVGTAITPLLASVEYEARVRQLALSHLLIKVAGVFGALMIFPWFLDIVTAPVRHLWPDAAIGWQLAAFHTGFNGVNALIWATLAAFALKAVRWLWPDPELEGAQALPLAVRRMLVSAPDLALAEARRLLGDLRHMVRDVIDPCLERMSGRVHDALTRRRVRSFRAFEAVRESLLDLLMQLGQRARSPHVQLEIGMMLREAGQCGMLHDLATDLESHLVTGLMVDRHPVPAAFQAEVVALRSELDAFWLAVLFPGQGQAPLPDLDARFDRIDQELVQHLRLADGRHHGSDLWLQDAVAQLRQICLSLRGLVRNADPGTTDAHPQGVSA
ncbi:MAG: Na/Pi symporter [Candidatus Sericytochromatia bacterium]|nr:Na/Pi symporter [Candidatus Sericytochromatia bacterium]